MIYGTKKDRPSMGVDEPVETKKQIDGELLGYHDSSQIDYQSQHYAAFRAGYDYAYDFFMPRVMELEDSLRWYINRNVTNIFQDIGFDGAEAARQRSTQRFWDEYQGRDAA